MIEHFTLIQNTPRDKGSLENVEIVSSTSLISFVFIVILIIAIKKAIKKKKNKI